MAVIEAHNQVPSIAVESIGASEKGGLARFARCQQTKGHRSRILLSGDIESCT